MPNQAADHVRPGALARWASLLVVVPWASCVPADPTDPLTGEVTSHVIIVSSDLVTEGAAITSGGAHYKHAVEVSGGWCAFETILGSIPDTVITLEGEAFNYIDADDDSGPGLGSLLIRNVPAGKYYVDVRGYGASDAGSWTLAVSCGTDPVLFHEEFTAAGDAGQCTGQVGIQSAIMGAWNKNILIDADNRGGYCNQRFAVSDPQSAYAGLAVAVNFTAAGDASQCIGMGFRSIPVSTSTEPAWSTTYGIDTDGRSGGCWQTFSLSGRNDVELDVEFFATGDGQCGNTGSYAVTSNAARAFFLDTDNRVGGCTQRFRLKRRPPCVPQTSCNGACGTISNGCGGTLDCGTCGGGGGCPMAPTDDPGVFRVICPE